MRRTSALLTTMAAVTVMLGLVVGAAGATPGTAVYSVQFSAEGVSHSYTVTETVSTTSSPSSDTLILALASATSNLTYSRSVNSSDLLQPFLPAVSNQSFSYSANGTSVSANIARNGTIPLTFQGKSYSLASYAYSATVNGPVPYPGGMPGSLGGALPGSPQSLMMAGLGNSTVLAGPLTLSGSISAFPSGLVYSAKGGVEGMVSFSITLVSTTLPLNAGGASMTAQVASIGVGAGAVVSALGIGLGVRHRQHSEKTSETKPDHWVD